MWGKIHAGDLPTCFCQGDNVRACAATNIDGATGLVLFDEFCQFGRADAGIPRGLAEVPILKEQAAEQIFHFSYSPWGLNVILGM